MKTNYFMKVFLILFCYTIVGQTVVAESRLVMPFKYRNTQNGETFGGDAIFEDPSYFDGNTDCGNSDHRTPDNLRYAHGHSVNEWGFMVGDDEVTVQKSDWAWDAHYPGYTRVIVSNFSGNCYSTHVSAPVPVVEIFGAGGWTAWTIASSQCEVTESPKGYKVPPDHCVTITSTDYAHSGEWHSECVIFSTREKDSSSGVYIHGWGPLGKDTNWPVRKRK